MSDKTILQHIAESPFGVGMDALCAAFPDVPRRTLQRRLAALVQAQHVVLKGRGRGARYVLPATQPETKVLAVTLPSAFTPPAAHEPGADYPTEAYVPTSPEGEAIKAYVRQPRHLRKPVGYQQPFLEAYQPNVTAYLPPPLRAQLHVLGQSPAAQTPAGTFARDILHRLLIDLSWASSRLEGNTYSRLDTERLIAQGRVADGKDALETQMILNHKEAIEYLVGDPARASLTPDTLLALHALLSDGLMADPMAVGRLRLRAVEIGGSVYLPMSLPQGLQDLFGIVVQMAAEIDDPFEQAFFLMVHLPYLQPFEDVNKRVSRLAANIPFIRTTCAHCLSSTCHSRPMWTPCWACTSSTAWSCFATYLCGPMHARASNTWRCNKTWCNPMCSACVTGVSWAPSWQPWCAAWNLRLKRRCRRVCLPR